MIAQIIYDQHSMTKEHKGDPMPQNIAQHSVLTNSKLYVKASRETNFGCVHDSACI